MRLKTSCRRLRAKPADAFAQKAPAAPPQPRESMASSSKSPPERSSWESTTPPLMSFTRLAVMKGIMVSMMDSPTIKISVRTVGFLNSLTQATSRLSMKTLLS